MARTRGNIKRTCPICGTEFYIYPCDLKLGRGIYCSQACGRKANETRQLRQCGVCGKEFWADRYTIERGYGKYCSRECRDASMQKRTTAVCQVCGKPLDLQPCQVSDKRGKYCSRRCYGIDARNPDSDIRVSIRRLHKYRIWRHAVLRRDGHRCQCCGVRGKDNIRLHAHHITQLNMLIKTFNIDNIDKAIECSKLWDTSNGITYCEPCHLLLHSNMDNQMEIAW